MLIYCVNCDEEIDADSNSCPYCGTTEIVKKEVYTNKKCPICGVNITNSQISCPNCGKKFYKKNSYQKSSYDNNFVAGLLSFIFPYIGLFFYFVYRKTDPDKADSVLLGIIMSIAFVFGIPCLIGLSSF